MFTLTRCHRTPADTPTRPCLTVISTEHQLDDVACACYLGRKGGAAALLHQGCPVAIQDCQVVPATGGMIFNVKCSELQRNAQSVLDFNRLGLEKAVWVVVGVVWRGDDTCCKEYELHKRGS